MSQSDHTAFLALEERVKQLEARLDVLAVKLEERLLDMEELLGPLPDHAADRKLKAEQYPRGTGRRIAS